MQALINDRWTVLTKFLFLHVISCLGLADGHLWFSIFSRPPNSNFTRVQRLSCCLCLLCCTMITSAMFYNMGGDGPSPFSIHIGSLVIDLKQFVIALQSSLIIVPVNVAIVQIFRNLRPKQSKKDKYSEETETDSQDKENEEAKPKGKLPHWFIYIAYLLCYLASAASTFFTLLYSIQWGKEKSTEWVIAMVTAFLQSVLLLQPVKVLVLAVVFAVFVRKPSDADEQDDTPVTYKPPTPATLPRRRKKTIKRKIYRSVYNMYVGTKANKLVIVVSFSLQTPRTGDVTRSSYKTFERNQNERNYERNSRILYFPHHAHECRLLPPRSQHVPYDEDVIWNIRWSRRLGYWFGSGKISFC